LSYFHVFVFSENDVTGLIKIYISRSSCEI